MTIRIIEFITVDEHDLEYHPRPRVNDDVYTFSDYDDDFDKF